MAADIEMGFKVDYRGEKRRFPAPSDASFESVTAHIRKVYGIPPEREITLTYLDEDEDRVTFSTTEELKEGMRIARLTLNSNTMQILVNDREQAGPSSSLPTHSDEQVRISSVSASSSSASEWPRYQKKDWKFEQKAERRLHHYEFREQKRHLNHMKRQEKREEKQIAKDKEFAARFVAHMTIPDLSCIPKGEKFRKTWRFRNEGSCVWPADTRLVFISKQMGDLMGASDSVLVPRPISPNEEVDISVDFTAPLQQGQYCGYWRLCLSNGRKFGQRVWCRIQVVD